VLVQIVIPFLVVTCTFSAVHLAVNVPTQSLVLVVLLMSDFMALVSILLFMYAGCVHTGKRTYSNSLVSVHPSVLSLPTQAIAAASMDTAFSCICMSVCPRFKRKWLELSTPNLVENIPRQPAHLL